MKKFESLNCPLDGVNLVEAAAGTGKTYNILNIVMRMLVEKEYPISSIAVLSYTNEAADELKNRLRVMIDYVISEIDGMLPAEDEQKKYEQAKQFVEKYRNRGGQDECERIRKILSVARRSLDEAHISTINGFCHQVLTEYAFESGLTFNTELDTFPEMKIQVLFNDWKRRHLYHGDRGSIFLALKIEKSLKEKIRYVQDKSLILRGGEEELEEAGKKVSAILNRIFNRYNEDIFDTISWCLKKRSKPLTAIENLNKQLPLRKIDADLFEALQYCTPDAVNAAAKKEYKDDVSAIVNEQPFFAGCAELVEMLPGLRASLCRNALTEVRRDFDILKQRERFLTFSDQIQLLEEKLRTNVDFREIMRKKFNAGIIDEFQDTDSLQYNIFKMLFFDADHCCFFVGDPRQAIYGFRGGDLFVYLAARGEIKETGKVYYLDKNYRSSAGMVKSINQIFADHNLPFGRKDLPFPQLESRAESEAPGLSVNGEADKQALRFWKSENPEDKALYKACAGRIVELLNNNGELIPDKKSYRIPKPSDIAVLVKSHYEAALMRDLLRGSGVMAVCARSGNVFKSAQAKELYILLSALTDTEDRGKINGALITDLCGVESRSILENDEIAAGRWGMLQKLSDIWRTKSFAAMFESLLSSFNVRERFARMDDGERALTNLLQLGELLQNLSVRFNCSPEALISEFAKFTVDDSDNEEFQEVLYSERQAVKVMTFHASKGLEFPIVMVPALQQLKWKCSDPPPVYHDGDAQRILDLSDSRAGELAAKEQRLELLRLAYVVLTRAKYRCEVFYDISKNPGFSAADYIFRPGVRSQDIMTNPDIDPESFSEVDICIEQKTIKPSADGSIYSGTEEKAEALVPPPEKIDPLKSDWQVISYSHLTRDVHASGAELPFDRDQELDDSEQLPDKTDFSSGPFALPKGAVFGTAVHWIYENADFTTDMDRFGVLVSDAFRIFKLLPGAEDESKNKKISDAAKWLFEVLHSPLPGGDGEFFTLSEIGSQDKVCELEFNYSLGAFDTHKLQEVLTEYACGEELSLTAWPENWYAELQGGILNGFVDLLFRRNGKYYILDWKTNTIDNRMENFSGDGLKHEMVHKLYFLQYLLYLVALVRHLRLLSGGNFGKEDYEEKIGGVYYIFVRGVSPAYPGRGVFYARPPWSTVEKLEKVLCR